MKEGIIYEGPKVEIIDSPIPTPNADQVLIKVVYSGSNPKDWKSPEWTGKNLNQGDDIAGTIHSVGENVTEFKVGDRVAAFHEIRAPHGSYAEYAIAWSHTTFHIPKNTSFKEAATLPLAAMTAASALYKELCLAPPFRPATAPTPLLIYGGASAIGAFAIQLAQKSNIHPIITVAGRGIPFVEKLLDPSKGDVIIDYRKGDDAVVAGIKDALKGHKLLHCFDGVSENRSYVNAAKAMAEGGKISTVLPVQEKEKEDVPKGVEIVLTMVMSVHDDAKDFGFVYFRLLARGLQEGWFKPHPHEIIEGGLAGVEKGLKNLKDGKASAVKYIFKIADTPGAGQE